MKAKIDKFLARFFEGVTFFHLAGFTLMIFGGAIGTAAKVGGDSIFGSGFGITLHITAAQVFGAVVFFYELVKTWLRRPKGETK